MVFKPALLLALVSALLAAPAQAYVFPGEYRLSVILDDGRYRFPAQYLFSVSHDQVIHGRVDYPTLRCVAQLLPQPLEAASVRLQETLVDQRPLCAPRQVQLGFLLPKALPVDAEYLRLTPASGEQLRSVDSYTYQPTDASRFLLAQQLTSPTSLSAARPDQALDYLAVQLQPGAIEHALVDQLFQQALSVPPPEWSLRLLLSYSGHPQHRRLTDNWLAELARQPWQAEPDARQQAVFSHLAAAGLPQSQLDAWQQALQAERRQRVLLGNDRQQLEAFVAVHPADTEAQATLLAHYRAENSFAASMAAFALKGEADDIRRALAQAETPTELAQAEQTLVRQVPFDRLFRLVLSERQDSPLRTANQSALLHSMTAQVKDIERTVRLAMREDSPLSLQQAQLRVQIDFVEHFDYQPALKGRDEDILQQSLTFHLHPANAWSDEQTLLFSAVPVQGTFRPGGVGALNLLGGFLGGPELAPDALDVEFTLQGSRLEYQIGAWE